MKAQKNMVYNLLLYEHFFCNRLKLGMQYTYGGERVVAIAVI